MTKLVSLLAALVCFVLGGVFALIAIPFSFVAAVGVAVFDFFIDWARTFYSTSEFEEWEDE